METGSLASVPPLDDTGGEFNEGYEADCNAATTSPASISLDISTSDEPTTSKDIAHLDSNPINSASMTSLPTTEAQVHQAQTSTSVSTSKPAEEPPSEPPSSSTPTRL